MGRNLRRAASSAAPSTSAPFLALRLRELDDEDRVLGREADQHHEPHLNEHVVVEPASHTPANAPSATRGVASRTAHGSFQLS